MSCGTPAPALLPAVAVRDDGVIGVAYYSLRANTPDPNTLPTVYMLATSSDGVTWTERQLADPFDYATAALAGGRYFIGDYMGMTTIGTSFVPFFAQTTGDPNNRSDITAALARATTAVPLRDGAPVKSTHDRGSDDRRIRAARGGERAPRAGGAAACRDPAGTIALPLTSVADRRTRRASGAVRGQTLKVPDREFQGSDP